MQKTDAYRALEAAAEERILILDGSVGVMLQERGLGEDSYRAGPLKDHPLELLGDSDALCLSAPHIVRDVHRSYLEAGADIIKTNSFTATRLAQEAYGLGDRAADIARASARIVREAIEEFEAHKPGRPHFVAGVIGPTGESLTLSRSVSNQNRKFLTFDELVSMYREQAQALVDGGADLFLIETIFDALNAKAAIYALRSIFDERGELMPVIISGTIVDRSGRSLTGQTPAAFMASMLHARPFALGLNCAFGAEALLPFLDEIARRSPFRVSVHPNAGLPNAEGGYDERPESFAAAIAAFARQGSLNVAGGCCGTRPSHIAALAEALRGIAPRPLPTRRTSPFFSGLELLEIGAKSGFVNVGERTNVAGSKKFARLVREAKWDESLAVARDQIAAGAQMIDICMDDPLVDSKAAIDEFLARAAVEPDIARVPFMVDSSDFPTVIAALKRIQGRAVVNSISLKEGEGPFLEKARAIADLGAAVVVMAFDEEGQAATLERRVSVLERAYRLLVERGIFEDRDIILDPNIFAIGTGIAEHRSYALDFFESLKRLKAALPGVLISGGVSNVSFAFRGNEGLRAAIHSVFLHHAIAAGMDLGIVNPQAVTVYESIDAELRTAIEDLLFDRSGEATERLVAVASRVTDEAPQAAPRLGREKTEKSLEERIVDALVAGDASRIASDAEEARKALGGAYAVISGPLMRGMDRVGQLFGEGKMFLPQVVKSARVMREAVTALTPYLEAEGGSTASRGRVVLATVKGDVHDIGKNIVSVVLRCNGYEVIDLGVMVEGDAILDTAERERADAIGLSGLIMPSLAEMEKVAAGMEKRGMRIPLIVGGATTSPTHTALKIATRYSGPGENVRDASQAAPVLARLLDPKNRSEYEAQLAASHEALRQAHLERSSRTHLVPIAEARSRASCAGTARKPAPAPRMKGLVDLSPALSDLSPYFDWSDYARVWKLDAESAEARNLRSEARAALDALAASGYRARALCAVLPVARRGDDVVVYHDESRSSECALLRFLRQQRSAQDGERFLCLADYVAQEGDWLGIFALSSGTAFEEEARRRVEAGDEYGSLILKTLGVQIAEAASEWLHAEVRRRVWAYAPDEDLSPLECLSGKFIGIRPAPGYPACPDHRSKTVILDLLEAGSRIGVSLTESYMMRPEASICGFYFAAPDSRYFAVGPIGPDQLADYAERGAESLQSASSALGNSVKELSVV